MPPLRIVFLSPAAQGGGAEEALFDLIAGLKTAEPDWSLHVISGESGPLLSRLRNLNVETELFPFPPVFLTSGEQARNASAEGWAARVIHQFRAAAQLLRYSFTLGTRLRQLRPDIIHSNGMKMHLVAALARTGKAALVWHLHDYLGLRKLTSRLLPLLRFRVRLALANSRSVAADARPFLRDTRIEVLENSVDLTRFQPEGPRLDLDQLSGLAEAPPGLLKIGLIATFARWKGQDIFIQAISHLPADLPARFYIIGGPVYATSGSQWTKDELVRAAAPAAPRLGFTGWVDDAASALRALDIVVHASSKAEPFGLVIIQALACGKAVVVSGEGGAAEIVEGLPDAVTFIPRDPASLAAALRFFIDHPEKRISATTTGPAAVQRRFRRNHMASLAAGYFRSIVPHAA